PGSAWPPGRCGTGSSWGSRGPGTGRPSAGCRRRSASRSAGRRARRRSPRIRLASWPLRNRIIVGIARTWYWAAVCWLSSTFSFTIRRSSRSPAISSDPLGLLAVAEQDHRGDREDLVLGGRLLVVVDVQLHDPQVVALAGDLL